MMTSEFATAHGYLSATVKGHAKERAREWRKLGRDTTPATTGKPNLAGWQRLTDKFTEMGWSVQAGGDRLMTQ